MTDATDHDAALRRLHRGILDAWNRRDATGFAALFAPDGSVVGFDGSAVDGAGQIERHLAAIFADHTPARYVALVREVRRLGPRCALLRAAAGMVPPGSRQVKSELNTVQSVVGSCDEAGVWRGELFQNTPAAFHGRPDAVDALTAELQRQADAERAW